MPPMADERLVDRPTPGPSEPVEATLTDAEPSDSLSPIGAQTGDRYTVHGEHARGGLGRVLRADDNRLGRPVALKQLINRDRGAARFEWEARITARLQHPGVVPVYDAGVGPDGDPYYAMKFVSGETLRDLLSSSGSLDERLALVARLLAVAETVAYAHEQGVIHRDLKPANVVVGDFGETVVIDWGLAKLIGHAEQAEEATESGSPELTVAGAVLGTPAFMAPEQRRGEELDERADVYALGAMLYQLLTGRRPFDNQSAEQILANAEAEPARLRNLVTNAPSDLVTICERAMSVDKQARYPSAAEFAADLVRFQAGQRVKAHSYGALELTRRWVVRHARALVALCLFLGVAAILVAMGRQGAFLAVCEPPDTDRVWSDARRASIAEAFATSGIEGAGPAWARIEPRLGEYVASWRDAHVASCRATRVAKTQSEQHLSLRMDCLAARLRDATALLGALESPGARAVEQAAEAVDSLLPVRTCEDVRALEAGAPPPAHAEIARLVVGIRRDLATARALLATGDRHGARASLVPLMERANATDYRRVIAEVSYELGRTLSELDVDAEAATRLEAAYYDAVASGDQRIALNAGADLIEVFARTYQFDRLNQWAPLIAARGDSVSDPALRARSLEALGAAHAARGHLTDAIDDYRAALELRKRGDSGVATARTMMWLSIVHGQNGDFGPRTTLAAEAQSLLANLLGESNLATLRAGARGVDEATLRAVLQGEQEATLSPREAVELRLALQRRTVANNRWDESLSLLAEAEAIATRELGEQSFERANAIWLRSNILGERGAYEQAIHTGRRALAAYRAVLGPEHPYTTSPMSSLGLDLLNVGGREEEALSVLRQALAILERRPNERLWSQGDILNNISIAYEGDEAVAWLARAAEVRERGLGPDHPKVGDTYYNLGNVLAQSRRFEESNAYLERAIRTYKLAHAGHQVRFGREHPDFGYAHNQLGENAAGQEQFEEAVRHFELAVKIRRAGDERYSLTARSEFGLAQSLWETGQDRDRALALSDQALSRYRKAASKFDQSWIDAITEWRAEIGHPVPPTKAP